jgi:hypothetical protein
MTRFLCGLLAAVAVALTPLLLIQPQALAYYFPNRAPGAPLEDEVLPPPSGWRLGAAMTFPYTLAASLAYVWPVPEGGSMSYKAGGTWGILNGTQQVATRFSDYRIYGALMYYLVPSPALQGGPYVELGLDVARASGAILPLNWPVVPHIGFGVDGRFTEQTAWDLNFSATANGVLSLDAGLLY